MTRIFDEIPSGPEAFEVSIGFNDISIKRNDIIQLLGYGSKTPPEYFSELLDSAITCLRNRIHIRAGYRFTDAFILGKDKEPAAATFTLPEIIAASMKNSEKVVLFAATIGPEMEDLAREMIRKGDPVQGYIYDLLASAAVEACTEALYSHIKQKMLLENMNVTNRYSPGYCSWNVEQQEVLFSYLPDNFCGIRLTASSLMLPVKSVSGIIGAGSDVRYSDYFCGKCEIENCIFRSAQAAREKLQGKTHQAKKI